MCKHKHIIRVLAGLLIAMMVISTAWADTYIHGFFRYTVADDSVTITRYTGNEEVVTVPAMIGGHPVNTIAKGAFVDTPVRTIKLPDTIMTVEEGAFAEGQTVVFNYNLEPTGQQPAQPDRGDTSIETPEIPSNGAPDNASSGAADNAPSGPWDSVTNDAPDNTPAVDQPVETVPVDKSAAQEQPADVSAPVLTVGSIGEGEAEDGDSVMTITSTSKDREQPTAYPEKSSVGKTIAIIAVAAVVAAAVVVVYLKKGRNKA